MENPKLNNNNLENNDTLQRENLPEHVEKTTKKEKVTLEIEGQVIEAEKYYFEYPKHIQKETGILGYERIKIFNEKFKNLKDLGWEKETKLIEDTLFSLSDGEYPNKCMTHTIGADANQVIKEKYSKYFSGDKFFLQKIFDLKRVEKEVENGTNLKDLFSHGGGALKLYDKNNKELVLNHANIGEISNSDLLEKQLYAVKPFNLAPGRFWSPLKEGDIAIGFSVFSDPFFKEYLESSVSLLLQHKTDFLDDSSITDVKDMFSLYLVSEYGRLGFLFGNLSNNDQFNKDLEVSFISKINQITKDFLKEKNISYSQSTNNIKMGEYTIKRLFGRSYSFKMNRFHNVESKIDISILINQEKIPQLSWGHAKYAHYFNDKGLNFFKFKHADHLPTKEK